MSTPVTIGTSGQSLYPSDYSDESDVIIRDGVTSINWNVFYGKTTLKTLFIPDSVKSISENAFRECTNLTSIRLPNGITSIAITLFNNCSSLLSIVIPDSVTIINRDVFYGCTSLTSITLPYGLTNIGNNCFRNCTSLTSITIPGSVTTVGGNIVTDCTSLKTIYMSSGSINYFRYYSSYDSNVSSHISNFANNGDTTGWEIILTLDLFTITPNITLESQGIINMTFNYDRITLTDISNSLIVDPSNVGIINNITYLGSNTWTANLVPQIGLILTDCSLNFKYEDYSIDQTINFNIDTTLEILDFSLTPSYLVDTDVSGILRIEFDKTVSSSSNFNFILDPSYIATLGQMSDVSGGFVWEGVLTRTDNMNKLGNKLEFDFSYNGVEVRANLVFDVVQDSSYLDEQYILYDAFNISVNLMRLSGNGEYALIYDNTIKKTFIYSYSSNDNNWVSNHNIDYSSAASWFTLEMIDISDRSRFIIGGSSSAHEGEAYLYDYDLINGETLSHTFTDLYPEYRGIYRHASLSNDGQTIALGNTHSNLYPDGTIGGHHSYVGMIEVFYYNGSSWIQKGQTLIGDSTNQYFGMNIQISGNGNVIRTNVANAYKTYYYISGQWQNKTDLNISNLTSVMNYDGTIYAISAYLSPNNYLVEIYSYNYNTDTSIKLSEIKFTDELNFNNNLNLSMSSNGNIIAVGYTSYNNNRGITLLHKNNGTSWENIYSIEGTIDQEQYGREVILSNDGKTLMTKNNNNECRIIKIVNRIKRLLTSSIILNPSNIIYPNTTSNFQINFTTNDKILDDIRGNLQLSSSFSEIDTNSLALTNYGFRLEGNIVANPFSESDINKIAYYETVDISGESANFTINTNFEVLGCTLTPENLVETDVSAILRIEFDKPVSSYYFNFTLDPSYIATLGTMSDVSSGFVWEGVLTRTDNMNKLGNKLEFDFSYNGVEVSANLVFDVVENSQLINKKWNLSNSNTINNVFTSTLQMSPNGSLMGFINGANVEIYRKSESESESSNWVSDVSYIGHKFALTNNHIAIASDASLQIYDYSGNSWNIMNGGNLAYLNIIALSINVDGNVVAVSDNSYVKLFKNISNNWTHINTHIEASVNGLSLSPNGLKLGMGIRNVGEDFSSIVVEDVVVVVVDTTPPVIRLDGSATMTIEQGTPWVEPGYTATDNFDGVITNNVEITGNVYSDVSGVYTLYYDVSDNAGNVASQVTRTVNVVEPTPVWSEPDTDILELSLFKSECDLLSDRHKYEYTLSGQASYLNGDYVFETSSYRGGLSPKISNKVLLDHSMTLLLSNNQEYYESCLNHTFNHTSFGSVTYMTKPYDSNGNYTGSDTNNVSINPAFYSQLCNDANTYNGEYIEVKFPFLIQFSRIYLGGIVDGTDITQYFPDDTVLLALKDDDTYDFISRYTDTNIDEIDHTMTSTNKYKGFKFVFLKCGSAINRETVIFDTLKCYGDIYN